MEFVEAAARVLRVVVGFVSSIRITVLIALSFHTEWVDAEQPSVVRPCLSMERIRDLEEMVRTLDPASTAAKRAVDSLIAVISDDRCPAVLRHRAGMLLGRIGEPAAAAVPVLLRLRSGDNRYWALKSLGLFGEVAAGAVGQLAPELHDLSRESGDRILVADVLGQIGTGPAIEALGQELLRRDRSTSGNSSTDAAGSQLLTKTVLDAISLAGPKAVGALPAIVRSLEHPESEIRRKSCLAIGQLGPQAEPAIDSVLERLALDDSPEVQDAAAAALGQLGPNAVPVLLRVVRDAPPGLQWRAARSLGRFGSTWTGTRIDPRRGLGEDRPTVVRELVAQFESEDSRVRIESLESVWRIQRRPELVAIPLIAELGSADRQTRMAAIRVLVELDELPDEATDSLTKLCAEPSAEGRSACEVLRKRLLFEKQSQLEAAQD